MTPAYDVILGSSEDCICGLAQRGARIVGGQEVEVNEWPWQVGILIMITDLNIKLVPTQYRLEWFIVAILLSSVEQL